MVPSLTMDPSQLALVTGAHHYEERQLFSLMRLRHPGVQVVYVTSKLLPELVVDAVLELMPGVPTSHARRRLHLFDTFSGMTEPAAIDCDSLGRPASLLLAAANRATSQMWGVCPLEEVRRNMNSTG